MPRKTEDRVCTCITSYRSAEYGMRIGPYVLPPGATAEGIVKALCDCTVGELRRLDRNGVGTGIDVMLIRFVAIDDLIDCFRISSDNKPYILDDGFRG